MKRSTLGMLLFVIMLLFGVLWECSRIITSNKAAKAEVELFDRLKKAEADLDVAYKKIETLGSHLNTELNRHKETREKLKNLEGKHKKLWDVYYDCKVFFTKSTPVWEELEKLTGCVNCCGVAARLMAMSKLIKKLSGINNKLRFEKRL